MLDRTKTRVNSLLATIDSFGERNCRILAWRHMQRLESKRLAWEVNAEWHDRAWNTPDMAMCLGRHYTRD